jgi:hypothetical protein
MNDDLDFFAAPEPATTTTSDGNYRYPVHCLCGRFAKFIGTRHYYDGLYDCETLTVECKRCGVVDIEMV